MVDRRLPAPTTRLPALMTGENKIFKLIPKWSESRKKHKTDDIEFLPVAGSRPFLPLENVTLLVNLVPFFNPGHINCQNLMKFGSLYQYTVCVCMHRYTKENSTCSLVNNFDF